MSLDELHVVSHTHWDREWYHTAERFRLRLVALIDELLDDPPHAGESFLLDGQAILLEDYLAVRPERAGELASLLRDGRIEAGPWYVLADELIPSGEALVRNLIAGRETVRRLRGEPPPVLYCPDSFGHPAALPDLAAGFGCDVIVLWRGYGRSRWLGDMVRWRGTSGTTALLYHLPPDGYEFGSSLPVEPEAARVRAARIIGELAPRAATGAAILLNGADHHARQRDRDAAIAALAAAAAPVRVRAASLRSAALALADAARGTELPVVSGELRDSYGYTWTLQGTLGTRAAQKRRNARAERRLLGDVEPWLALQTRGGASAGRALLGATWRTLLQAHPHDTLCGTSIDAVADAFDAKLASVEQASRALREDAVHSLLSHDGERARTESSLWRPVVVLRNPVARPRGGVAELTLRATLADIAVGPGSAQRQGVRRRAPTWRVAGVPLQILHRREGVELTESPRAYPDADLVLEASAVGWVVPMRGYSVATRDHRKGDAPPVPHPVRVDTNALDNGRVRIEVDSRGTVQFIDHELGRRIADVVSFERRRDVGDLYTPALREMLPLPSVRRVRVIHRGPLRGEIAIDFDIGARAAGGVCRVGVQLDADARFMRLIVSGENRERDHRLRLRIATALHPASTLADAAFRPVPRVALSIPPSDALMEHVVPTAPLHRWVSQLTHDAGATLVSDGLAEYESGDDGSISVTLVRSVGQLSRHDLPERPGHAGWPAATPGAQCLGPFEARFALLLHGGDLPGTRDEIVRFAEDALLPIVGETLRSNLLEPHHTAGLELHGDGLVFSAAAPARREGWIVLRCVNQSDGAATGEWRLARGVAEAWRARLDETPLGALVVRNGVIHFEATPGEVVTILAH